MPVFRAAIFLKTPLQMKRARAFGFPVSMEALQLCLRSQGGLSRTPIITRLRTRAVALLFNAAVGFKPACSLHPIFLCSHRLMRLSRRYSRLKRRLERQSYMEKMRPRYRDFESDRLSRCGRDKSPSRRRFASARPLHADASTMNAFRMLCGRDRKHAVSVEYCV